MQSGETPRRRRPDDAFDYGVPPSDRPEPGARAQRATPPGGGSPPRRKRRRWLSVTGVIVALVIIGVVGAGVVANNKFNLIERLGLTGLDAAAAGGPRNYLIVGSDDRAGLDPDDPNTAVFLNGGDDGPTGQRADAIMILRVDPGAGKVDVVSIPRDLWVPIAGWDTEERINTAYTEGPQQLVDTIREDFGVEINHYIEIDFVGFQSLVDAVGGVPMWFDTPMRDPNSGLDVAEAGCVSLDGYQALAFVRARYLEQYGENGWETDPTGDAGRVSRQQVFIQRVLAQAARELSLTDIGSLNQLADVAINYVSLDAGLDVRELIDLGRRFTEVGDGGMTFHSLPTERWFTPGGADVQLLQAEEAESVLSIFRGGALREVTPTLKPVTVLNGSSVEGQAGRTASSLEQAGFTVAETGNAAATYTRTTVRYGAGGEPTARYLARFVAGGADLEPDDGLPDGAVILVTGTDFSRVLPEPTTSTSSTEAPTRSTGTSTTSASGAGSTSTTVEVIGVLPGEPPEGVSCP